MRKLFFVIGLVIVVCSSCNSWKDSLASAGDTNAMIYNCILDYSHTKTFKKFKVFQIGDLSLYEYDIPSDIALIWISPLVKEDKIYPYLNDTIGCLGSANIPTRYVEIDGRLLVWNDVHHPITEELINTYKKYDIIDYGWLNEYYGIPVGAKENDYPDHKKLLPPYNIYEWVPYAFYYICKNNFKKYLRVSNELNSKQIAKLMKCD